LAAFKRRFLTAFLFLLAIGGEQQHLECGAQRDLPS
jgi:hypothetical protein